jgi:hypothetical protein
MAPEHLMGYLSGRVSDADDVVAPTGSD